MKYSIMIQCNKLPEVNHSNDNTLGKLIKSDIHFLLHFDNTALNILNLFLHLYIYLSH